MSFFFGSRVFFSRARRGLLSLFFKKNSLSLFLLSPPNSYQVVDVRHVDGVLEHVVVLASHLDRAVDRLPLGVLELRHEGDRGALSLGEVGGAFFCGGGFFCWCCSEEEEGETERRW